MLLKGIRVLDLTRLAPGPFCTMTLGDMGADVLKIEDTTKGDYLRTFGPVLKAETAHFLMLNRNKRSMTLNLKEEAGREILRKLIGEYDILIESFRPGVMDRLGLGYDSLSEINPRLIYCSISGYGQYGPMKSAPGHDLNYLAVTGILDSFANPGEAPFIPEIFLGDIVGGGMWATIGILAAVNNRNMTGKGQYIDVGMYDGLASLLNMYADSYFRGVPFESVKKAYYNTYRTSDNRFVVICAGEPKFWINLCNELGKPEYISRLGDGPEGQAEMKAEFDRIFATKTQAEWSEQLFNLDVAYSPIYNIEEVFDSEHFRVREMEWRMNHPVEGEIRSIGFPVKFKEDPASIRMCPPLYGEHTDEVLRKQGYSDEQICELREAGVIV